MTDISKHEVPASVVVHPDYPRTSTYDPAWVWDNGMGWPVLWATEALAEKMQLRPGMRVLDLGCGKAMSSIFLAKEYGVQVWAVDLWISATDNACRIREMGLDDLVFPLHADAHALPFAEDFFDAILSIGSYHYFGTDDCYLPGFIRLVKPGGQFGMCSPGLTAEFGRDVPPHLREEYAKEWYAFHSPDWWRWHWEKTGLVDIEVADLVPGGWDLWMQYEQVAMQMLNREPYQPLIQDKGRYIGFPWLVARRKA
jgi:SAM-dependent methyltransferase